MRTRRDAIREYIENLADDEQVDLWNDYCDVHEYYDDRVESMESFNELFYGVRPLEIIRRLDGDFDPNDDWFYSDGLGNYCSTDSPRGRRNKARRHRRICRRV